MPIIITSTHTDSGLNVIKVYIAEVRSLHFSLRFKIHFIPILITINNKLQEFRERTGLKAVAYGKTSTTVGLLTVFFLLKIFHDTFTYIVQYS